MDTLLAARFPFLEESKQVASKNGADIEKLISSELFDEARKRGLKRVTDAIENSEVSYAPLISEYDRVMEVMSYPYARMIVSVIDDRFLTKRYALAESVRMNKLLGEELPSTVSEIARSLGVNSTLENEKLKMHFSDFLRFSTRIKSPEWQLVNSEVFGGYVFLAHDKFDRLLQNALQDRIESELPIGVPAEISYAISKDVGIAKKALTAAKNRFKPEFSGKLEKEELPPCIRTLLANAQKGVNLPHSGRFALVSFLHALGMNLEQILALFSESPDFDEGKSMYQIKHITGELSGGEGYTAPECSTMRTLGLCFEPDELCERMHHPLNYYRIKTRDKGAPKEITGNSAGQAPDGPARDAIRSAINTSDAHAPP